MIATHNTLTFCEPKYKIFNIFSFLWRCQELSVLEQIEKGAKVFDIRIRYDKDNNIVFCHGMVDLKNDIGLNEILEFLYDYNCKCRIIIERGNIDYENFKKEYNTFFERVIYQVIIKKDWKILYNDISTNYEIVDLCYVPFYTDKGFWWNIRHLKLSTIKKWSKKHNPDDLSDIIKDKKLYYIDFIK